MHSELCGYRALLLKFAVHAGAKKKKTDQKDSERDISSIFAVGE